MGQNQISISRDITLVLALNQRQYSTEYFWSLCFWCTQRLKIMSSLRLNIMWEPFGKVLLPLNSDSQLNPRPESDLHLNTLKKDSVNVIPSLCPFRIFQAGLKHCSRLVNTSCPPSKSDFFWTFGRKTSFKKQELSLDLSWLRQLTDATCRHVCIHKELF